MASGGLAARSSVSVCCRRALARAPSQIPGIGPKRAAALEKKGLATVADLLFRLPARYDDRRSLQRVGELEVGRRASFLARVLLADFVSGRGRGGRMRRTFQAVLCDETGTVTCTWFHGGDAIRCIARKGALLQVTG